MSDFERMIDIYMCVGWILTYILVLIGTIKYKYPLTSRSAQAFITTLEIAICVTLVTGDSIFNYAYFSYFFWAIIEIVIMYLNDKLNNESLKSKRAYAFIVMVVSLMIYGLLQIEGAMLCINYIFTTIGMIFWLFHILKKDYPLNPLIILIFIVKFISDIFAATAYFTVDNKFILFMEIFLPFIDFMFICVCVFKMVGKKKYDSFYDRFYGRIQKAFNDKKSAYIGKCPAVLSELKIVKKLIPVEENKKGKKNKKQKNKKSKKYNKKKHK